jgi:mono/diheme cytochrome c family protein
MTMMKSLTLILIPLFLGSVAWAQDEIPAGAGKDTVERVCTACHDLGAVVPISGNKDIWQSIVDDMRTRGADGTDDDFKTIVTYLTKYLGPPVNVNTAAAKDIETQLDLTTAEAAAIVTYRTANTKIKDWDDLTKVPGVDLKKIEPLKKRIKF